MQTYWFLLPAGLRKDIQGDAAESRSNTRVIIDRLEAEAKERSMKHDKDRASATAKLTD